MSTKSDSSNEQLLALSIALLTLIALWFTNLSAKTLDVSRTDWLADTKTLNADEVLRLESIPTLGQPDRTLLLRPFYVIDAQSRLRVIGPDGEREGVFPERRYLAGYVAGVPASRALVVIDDLGLARGLVSINGLTYALNDDAGGIQLDPIDMAQTKAAPFRCGNTARGYNLNAPVDRRRAAIAGAAAFRGPPAQDYIARIAIETDAEYYDRFNNQDDATAYAMDLVAFASSIYVDEVSTQLLINDLTLWTGNTNSDPWTQSGTACQLYQFGKYWNDNRGDIDRTVAHFLSGRSSNAGIAWVGVLCRGAFSLNIDDANCSGGLDGRDNYGGAYGVTSGIDGNFNLNNPNKVWDIIAFAHEIGHNFDSPHTHCYAGIGGNDNDVDQCFNGQADNGCYDGAESLPAGCPGNGQGCGTIMSYCHLRFAGGLNNIAFSFGSSFPYGDEPDRVPNRMFSHVSTEAFFNPACLTTGLTSELSISVAEPIVVEDEDFVVTLMVDPPATEDIDVDLAATGDLNGEVSNLRNHRIPAGQAELVVNLPTDDDNRYHPDRTGTIEIDDVTSDATIVLGTSAVAGTITDDEFRPVAATLAVDRTTLGEGERLTATVSLDQSTGADVDVRLALSAALAAETSSSLGPQTIPAGDDTTVFMIQFNEDSDVEADVMGEISIDSVDSAADASIGAPNAFDLIIVDDDAFPAVELSLDVSPTDLTEGESLTAAVTLDQSTTTDVSIELSLSPNLAAMTNSDLGSKVIGAGSTAVEFAIDFIDNASVDGDLEGTLAFGTISSNADTSTAPPASYDITLRDNDEPGGGTEVTVSIAAQGTEYTEGNLMLMTLSVDQAVAAEITVDLIATGGLEGRVMNLGGWVFGENERSFTVPLPLIDDDIEQGTRGGRIRIDSVRSDNPEVNAAIGTARTPRITVEDNDYILKDGFESR